MSKNTKKKIKPEKVDLTNIFDLQNDLEAAAPSTPSEPSSPPETENEATSSSIDQPMSPMEMNSTLDSSPNAPEQTSFTSSSFPTSPTAFSAENSFETEASSTPESHSFSNESHFQISETPHTSLDSSFMLQEELPPVSDEIREAANAYEEPDPDGDLFPHKSSDESTSSFMNPVSEMNETFLETKEEVPLSSKAPKEKSNLNQIKNYSDKLSPTNTNIPVNVPYSIFIDGILEIHEQERLLSIIERESLGIRTVEIDPQLQAGRVLIPRISEFAGVLIVQALRNAKVKIKLDHSEKIFQNKELSLENDSLLTPKAPNYVRKMEPRENRDEMILTPDSEIPGFKILKILETFQSSLNIRTVHVHASNSSFFQESLENVKKQLRLKAHHKGADALIRFKTELFPVDDNSQYKLLATAIAVKIEKI